MEHDPSKFASAEEFAKLREEVEQLKRFLDIVKPCSCDPSKYASQEEFLKLKREVEQVTKPKETENIIQFICKKLFGNK